MTWRDFAETAKTSMEQTLALRRTQVAEAEQTLALRRAQVADAEAALARIDSAVDDLVFVESVMASADDQPQLATEATSKPAAEVVPEQPATTTASGTEPVVIPATPAHAETESDLTTVTRPLSEAIQRTLQIMASADQPMRAREVVQALGEPDRRSVIESTRTRLKRLVANGYLTEQEGMFRIVRRVNGHTPEGAATADQ